MRAKLPLGIFLAILLAGCATVSKSQHIQSQQLQGRINYLEAELEKTNQEIISLEYELAKQQTKNYKSDKQQNSNAIQLSTKQIQTALKNAGFYKGSIDGKIGPKTKDAIKDFQKANGLKADGIAGQKTLIELKKYLKK